MKTVKRIACSFMALALVVGLTACSAKPFDHQTMVDYAEEEDFDELDEPEDFIVEYGELLGGSGGDGIYISCDGKDAQYIYDKDINRMGDFPDYDVDEATTMFFASENGYGLFFVITFEETKDAEKFYKKYTDAFASNSEEGKSKGITYSLEHGGGTKSKESYFGAYLNGNTVLVVRAMVEETDYVDGICKAYGVKSPTKVK